MSADPVEFSQLCAGGGARQDHDVNVTQHRFFPDSRQDLNAVMPGKMQIEHNDTGMCLMPGLPLNVHELKRFLPVRDNLDFDLFVQSRKSETENIRIGRTVIDDQNFRRGQGWELLVS